MAYVLTFGSYQLPATFGVTGLNHAASIPTAKLPRTDGDSVATRYLRGKTIEVGGGLTNGVGNYSETGVRTLLDTFLQNLQGTQNLYILDDRYYRDCQLQHADVRAEVNTLLKIVKVNLSFVSPDPYQYAVTPTTGTRVVSASGQTLAVTVGGTADAYGTISVTVGGSGAKTLAATITNSTTGQAFTLSGSCVGGDVIVVDCLNKTVKISGASRMDMFDGLFFNLANGANTLTEAYTSATISNLAVSFSNRWH